jgi:hypothetical protein
MIHFIPPHIDKLTAKLPELIRDVDVVLGNLEDAIPADAKEAARAGFIRMAQANAFGATGLWARINALNSPWALDDLLEIVGAVGNKLDVIMLPKVEGPWDIHYLDQLLAQLEAKHAIAQPILIHAILETAQGVNNVETIATASPPSGLCGAGGPPPRPSPASGGARRPAKIPTGPLALHSGQDGRCLRGGRDQAFLRAVRRLLRSRSPSGCSRPIPGRSSSRARSSPPCRTVPEP